MLLFRGQCLDHSGNAKCAFTDSERSFGNKRNRELTRERDATRETAVRTSHWMFRSRFNLLAERIHARPCVWSFCLKFPPQEGKTDEEKTRARVQLPINGKTTFLQVPLCQEALSHPDAEVSRHTFEERVSGRPDII